MNYGNLLNLREDYICIWLGVQDKFSDHVSNPRLRCELCRLVNKIGDCLHDDRIYSKSTLFDIVSYYERLEAIAGSKTFKKEISLIRKYLDWYIEKVRKIVQEFYYVHSI